MFKYTKPPGAATDSGPEQWATTDQDLLAAEHVVVQGMHPGMKPDAEPEFETGIATEDDFEDNCPLCTMLRERVRNGEEIQITRVKF